MDGDAAGTSVGTLISEQLAGFAAGLKYDKLPAEVRDLAKHLALDSVGIAFASGKFEWAKRALAGFASMDSGKATAIGLSSKLTVRDAAAMNGILVHGLDFDDTHLEGIMHVSSSCFPTAFGVSSHLGASGKDFLTAYVLAIEVAARLGKAAGGCLLEIGYHPTGMLASFSASLAAGLLHKLTPEQLVMAQGIALSTMGSSARQYNQEGAWTKRLHPGWNAASGIAAAHLAKHGFVGPRAAYEGKYGLYPAHLGQFFKTHARLDFLTAGLGTTWETLRVAVKPIPACHLTHACSDAIIEIVRKYGIKPSDVASIRALVPNDAIHVICEPVAKRRRPATSYEAQFSIQYVVAASMVNGRFSFRELEADSYKNAEILALADKVSYEVDPHSGHPVHFSGEVIVTTKDGRELAHREQVNRGAADRPLTSADIVRKFMENATLAMPVKRAEQIRDAMLGVDQCGNMEEVARLLGEG
jgi:2-methylcitrate dehydratase PrpD